VTAFEIVTDALRDHGSHVVERGTDNAQAQCPAHDDHDPSLSVFPRKDAKGVAVKCHAGCELPDVLAAVGLTFRDLYDDAGIRDALKPNADHRYPKGRVNKRRTDPRTGRKRFTQTGAEDKSLYMADKVPAGCQLAWLVEGEKAALMIWQMGGVAVATGGAERTCDMSPLRGIPEVRLLVDRDKPGLKWAERQRGALEGVASSVRFVRTPLNIPKADIVEHHAAGLDLAELEEFDPAATSYDDDLETSTGDAGWLSDSNVSELLTDRVLRGKYCWANGWGWMRFDGRRWVATTDHDVIEQSRLFANHLVAEQVAAQADGDKIRKYTKRLSAGAVRAAADLAKGQLLADGAAFDRHPDLLNAANGVVDLRTGELGPHDPALLLTRCAPTNYRPGAEHPDWDLALDALPADVAEWVQLRLGQAITGHPTPDDVLPVFHGAGSNGKTTLTTGVARTLGEGDYAVTVPERVLLANPNDHPTELMTLRGARLALLEETPEARHLNVKRLKDVLGTTQMTARHIRQDTVTWSPTHTLFVSTNYRPRVDETDHGTWRRLALVTFPYTYRRDGETLHDEYDRRGDPTLRERVKLGLQRQHEAILAWLVDGARRWYAAGQEMPPPPPAVADNTRAWRRETDLILRFFDDNLIADPSYCVPSRDLYQTFTEWLAANGHQKWNDQTFAGRFGQHDEIAGLGIIHNRVRRERIADRKRSFEVLSGRFMAWSGVRYRTADDDRQEDQKATEQGKRESGRGWTGGVGLPPRKNSHEALTKTPLSTNDQAPQNGLAEPAGTLLADVPADVPAAALTPRRPGCVCAAQPRPCHWCELAASNDTANDDDLPPF
jgi:putative DNA primase/helicase